MWVGVEEDVGVNVGSGVGVAVGVTVGVTEAIGLGTRVKVSVGGGVVAEPQDTSDSTRHIPMIIVNIVVKRFLLI